MAQEKRRKPESAGERSKKPSSEASGKAPPTEQQREAARQNQPGRGSGEGTTGMQRGAGHPTGR